MPPRAHPPGRVHLLGHITLDKEATPTSALKTPTEPSGLGRPKRPMLPSM